MSASLGSFGVLVVSSAHEWALSGVCLCVYVYDESERLYATSLPR